MPIAVQKELSSVRASQAVQEWSNSLPSWMEVRDAPASQIDNFSLRTIDVGERAAIELPSALHADLLLMDDRKGVKAAEENGHRVTGTLGVLNLAAKQGLLDLGNAFDALRRTNFRYPEELMQKLLVDQRQR